MGAGRAHGSQADTVGRGVTSLIQPYAISKRPAA
jgi:hypothetical protein